ncbi:MAG: hypothetical protein OEW58_05360 [Gammaproteobacteria bacterium]|nr:hypothetical protein [Gammaproteobacteria bacterium]
MMQREKLVEQRVLEYDARLRYLQEVESGKVPEANSKSKLISSLDRQLLKLREERQRCLDRIEQVKVNVRKNWQEDSFEQVGPMVIWEAVAKRIGMIFA